MPLTPPKAAAALGLQSLVKKKKDSPGPGFCSRGREGGAMLLPLSLRGAPRSLARPRGALGPQEREGMRGARRAVEAYRLPAPPVSGEGEARSPVRVRQLPEAAAQLSAIGLSTIFLAPCVYGGGERAPSTIGAPSAHHPATFLGSRYY
ncbi:hypothetical protein NDU88_003912 [Pleurodeles waltl]|uniref:Uncharacterized protein n=1 Tax=Pleurodeles waltl TaxID=8319 RepID=A0AAV7VHB3_PLEWA|nr:hypothetical protein NDU88_003912 [Pleurodeles waltl]